PFVEDLDINCFTGLGVPHPFLVDVDPYQRVEVIFVTRSMTLAPTALPIRFSGDTRLVGNRGCPEWRGLRNASRRSCCLPSPGGLPHWDAAGRGRIHSSGRRLPPVADLWHYPRYGCVSDNRA